MPAFDAPNTGNYAVFKGSVYFKKTGETDYRDLGNCTGFSFEPSIDKLDHYSNQSGVRTKDKSAVTGKSATVTVVFEEMNFDNVELLLLGGSESTNTAGQRSFKIMHASEITGALKFVGNNDIGPKWEHEFPNVTITPDGSFDMLQDDASWANGTLSAEVTADASGDFGTSTLLDDDTTTA